MMKLRSSTKNYIADPKEIEKIVSDFSKAMRVEMGDLIRSVVWFGSALRSHKKDSKMELRDAALLGRDIDVLIIFDDQVHVLTPELITAYRVVTEKTASKFSKRLHITTMPMTKFWDYSLKGDPILINMLRDGEPVFDTGCFGMAKKMLHDKNIKPTKEIVWIYLAKGPLAVSNANFNMRNAVIDLYWGVLDAAHAALLHHDIVPDSPDQLIPLMQHHLLPKGVITKKDLSIVGEFKNVGKMLLTGETHKVSGDQYDRYKSEADKFLHTIKEVLAKR